MPLFLSDGTSLDDFSYEAIKNDPILCSNASEFFESNVDSHSPLKCLYVGQREYATVRYEDASIDFVGSDSSTTCHILLIIDEENFNCSLCHFDGTELKDGISSMVNSLKKLSNLSRTEDNLNTKYSIYMVGGFTDPKKQSIDLTKKLFSYNIKQKKVYMSNSFLDKGPDMNVRGARHFSSNGNMSIYDPIDERLIIGPFDFKSHYYAEQCINLQDHVLLKYFSTSPQQEPENFVENLKESFRAMINYPNPIRSYFNEKSNIYTKQLDGSWKQI